MIGLRGVLIGCLAGLVAAGACVASSSPAASVQRQPAALAPASQLNWLVGDWEGLGSTFGSPGKARLGVHPALEGKFLELTYDVGTGGARAMRFQGRAFYRPRSDGAWQARWFDSRGVEFDIAAKAEHRALTSDWGGTASERGRTVYRLREDGRLEVVDSVLKDGRLREFARYVYHKKR